MFKVRGQPRRAWRDFFLTSYDVMLVVDSRPQEKHKLNIDWTCDATNNYNGGEEFFLLVGNKANVV